MSTVAPSLLPAPHPLGLGDVEAGLTVLYAFQNQQLVTASRDAEIQANANDRAMKAQKELEQAAAERQRKAARESGGFWGTFKKVASTVAKVASVVAGAAAVVASGGTALPLAVGIAGVALSGGGMAVRELKLLGKDSAKVGMWMEIGGAVIGVGGAAAAACGVTAMAGSGGSQVIRNIGTGASLTNSGGTAATATATVVLADYKRDADHAAADAMAARFAAERLSRETKLIIATAEDGFEASKDALDATTKAIDACNEGADVALGGLRG